MRKFLTITAIVLVAILAVFAVWIFFFGGSASDIAPTEDIASDFGRDFEPLSDEPQPLPDGVTDTSPADGSNSGQLFPTSGGESLTQLWPEPVAGAIFFERGGSQYVRLIEKATGHVYDVHAGTLNFARVTNTTIPRIQEVVWADESRLVLQYVNEDLDVVETFAATIQEGSNGTSTDVVGQLSGVFLPQGITSVDALGNNVAYMLGGNLIVSEFGEKTGSTLFSSPISGWSVDWEDTNAVIITPASSESAQSRPYRVTLSGNISFVLDARHSGLVSNSEGLYTIFSTSVGELVLRDNTNQTEESWQVGSIADKCAWGDRTVYCAIPRFLSRNLPDVWYTGEVRFHDQYVLKMDIEENSLDLVVSEETLSDSVFDMTQLDIDENEEALLFIDKTPHELWRASLAQRGVAPDDELLSDSE